MLAANNADSAACPACPRCRSRWRPVDWCWLCTWTLLHELWGWTCRPCQTPSVAPALQVRLWQFGKLLPPKLADHLEQHGALPVLYVSAWLLTSFSADFPLYFASRVMDVVLSDSVYEGGMKVRCLAAQKFVDWCSVVHCAACRLLLAVTEGPTGHTCGKCHRR